MIVASFAQQYGIRLYQEYDTISCEEFRQLLTGINGETPLGNVVRIRSEKDPKRINEMTNHEKKIRQEWKAFCITKNKNQLVELPKDKINDYFSQLFK